MAKKGNYERKVYEPTARDIRTISQRIRKKWTPSQRQARSGESLDLNAHAIGWLPPLVHVADIVGHPAFLSEHESDNR